MTSVYNLLFNNNKSIVLHNIQIWSTDRYNYRATRSKFRVRKIVLQLVNSNLLLLLSQVNRFVFLLETSEVN